MKACFGSRMLTAASCLIATLALGATKPIAQWSFEDSSNLGAASIGSVALSVAATSGATMTQVSDGHLDAAVSLRKGTTVANALVAPAGTVPSGTNPFSVSVWLRPQSTSASQAYLLVNRTSTGGYPTKWDGADWNGWCVRFTSNSKIAWDFQNGWRNPADDTQCVMATYPSGSTNDGKWHHLVITRDASLKASLYWDGKLLAAKTLSKNQDVASTVRLTIGGQDSGNSFSGDYDELKIWDSALSDAEIVREYNAKVAATTVEASAELSDVERVYGAVSGSGALTFSGIGYKELLAPLTFGGTYRAYAANVDLGYAGVGQTLPAGSKLELPCTGGFNVFGNTTVAGLSGAGVMGTVTVAEGKTLTVASDEDAVLAGRLNGAGAVSKTGTGTLTVKGASDVKSVAVAAGTLAVGRPVPFYAPGLTCYWRFDDADNLGRDLCDYAHLTAMTTDGGAVALTDGKLGPSLSLRKGTTVASALVAPAGKAGCGTGSFTVSAWIRPNSDSAANAYLLVNRSLTGGKPTAWEGSTWNGWHVRFFGQKLAAGYLNNGWASPDTQPTWFVTGTLPNSTCKTDGQWHQVVITRDSTDSNNRVTRIYFDGVNIGEGTIADNQSVSWGARLSLGGQDSGNSFSGDYDDVQVYNRPLSESEIASGYAAAKPKAETRLIDEATARWTFDELVTEGDRKLFKDTGAANLGCDFLNTTNASGQYVECVTGADINGGAAYVKHLNSYLQLADGSKAGANLVQYGWPTFTVSLRIKNVANTSLGRNPVFCFGNAKTAEGCLRLSYEGTSFNPQTAPQIVRILAGNSYTNGTSGVVLDDTISCASEQAPWTTYTFVNNQDTKVMTVYRDGVPVKTISTHGNQMTVNQTAFAFDLSRVDIGYNTYGCYSGFMVDDLCVFRKRVLSEKEVKRLVLEQAGLTGAPLAGSDVSVAAAATLDVEDRDCTFKSLAGAGAVKVGASATLAAGDWSSFTGTITGAGSIRISGWGPAQKVPKAVIAPTGTLSFASAPAGGSSFVIATADEFEAPADFSGWTVAGLADGSYRFKLSNGMFRVVIRGGFIILVR